MLTSRQTPGRQTDRVEAVTLFYTFIIVTSSTYLQIANNTWQWGAGLMIWLITSILISLMLSGSFNIYRKYIAQLDKHQQDITLLQNATTAVISALDLDDVLNNIFTQLNQVVPFDSACIFLDEGNTLRARASRGLPKPDEIDGRRFPIDDPLFQQVIRSPQPIILQDAFKNPNFQQWGGTHNVQTWMGIALTAHGKATGVLTLDHITKVTYEQPVINLAQSFANQAAIAIENAKLYKIARTLSERLVILHEASRTIIKAGTEPEQMYAAIHHAVSRLMPCEAFAITTLKDAETLACVYLIEQGQRVVPQSPPSPEGISGHVIQTGKAVRLSHADAIHNHSDFRSRTDHHAKDIQALVAVPIHLGANTIGMLTAQSYQPYEYTAEDHNLLELLAGYAAVAINNAQLFDQVQERAIRDDLTNVFNRRYFFGAAQSEFARARRYHHALSVIMVDPDHFKCVNDTHGHAVGDTAIQTIAVCLQDHIRESDVLARYGGDEFIVLLPETDLQLAIEIAERLRLEIQAYPIPTDHEPITITASLGIGTLNATTNDLAALLKCADQALYKAKQAGRDCVRFDD